MRRPSALWPRVVLGCAGVLLIAGIGALFRWRFAAGDVYPEYSTLRADPLGARVFYSALADAGLDVSQNRRTLDRHDPGLATIYLLGMDWHEFSDTDTADWSALLESVRNGARLVVTFTPTVPEGDAKPRSPTDEPSRRSSSSSRSAGRTVALPRELGVAARWLPVARESRPRAAREGEGSLPESLPWHTALSFEPEAEAWRRTYLVARFAAVVERSYGVGSIVLVGDAYLASNEAMVRERSPAFLAWLQGPHKRAVFDESHLGVVENTGVAALARRYGFADTASALVILALLFLWRNGSSLVPPTPGPGIRNQALEGRDASAGLVNLLRRTLEPRSIFAACFDEFRRSVPWRQLTSERQKALEAVRATAAADRRGLLPAMRTAHEILQRKV